MKRTAAVAVLFIAGLVIASGSAQGLTWTIKKLTATPARSDSPAVAADGLNVYVVWTEEISGRADIFIKRSTDGGVTWKERRRLSSSERQSVYADIAVLGPKVFVVWQDITPGGDRNIYVRRSMDAGSTWKAAQKLSSSGSGYSPAVAVTAQGVFVTWKGFVLPTGWQVFLRISTDNGRSWRPTRKITNWPEGLSVLSDPCLSAAGPNIFVAWSAEPSPDELEEIYIMKSQDAGSTWAAEERLTSTEGHSLGPALSSWESHVSLAWLELQEGDLYFMNSDDGGETWSAAQNLTWQHDWLGGGPALARSRSSVYVAYEVLGDIDFAKSPNNGQEWYAPQRVLLNSGNSYLPSIACSDFNIYLAWTDDTTGNYEIFFARAIDK